MVSSTGLGQFARAVIPLERANSCALTCAPAPPLRLPSFRNLQWTSQPDERRTHSPKNNNGPFLQGGHFLCLNLRMKTY